MKIIIEAKPEQYKILELYAPLLSRLYILFLVNYRGHINVREPSHITLSAIRARTNGLTSASYLKFGEAWVTHDDKFNIALKTMATHPKLLNTCTHEIAHIGEYLITEKMTHGEIWKGIYGYLKGGL